ncbi:MAG: hypothetical protein LBN10_09315 [Propionibacteriaceae bacterium]|nr:hypothetical protein [Propionibacteriaceae bacterium]
MKRHKTYGVVTVEGEGNRSLMAWLTDHLAQHPGWVTLITCLAASVVTWAVLGLDDRLTPTDVITTLAGLWALFFGIMIYLLSAQDTDHIISQISDLQTQLSRALTSPDDEDIEESGLAVESGSATPPEHGGNQPGPSDTSSTNPVDTPSTGPDTAQGLGQRSPSDTSLTGLEQSTTQERPHERRQDERERRRPDTRRKIEILTTAEDIARSVPEDFLHGWSSATGLALTDVTRAWTRDPSDHQWVLETDSSRWLVFARHGHDIGIVPLHPDPRQVPGWRDNRPAKTSKPRRTAAPPQ